ncbi:sensor domain-containing diguanylate cyclase [Gilvimarinus agarilyticus]|uniref:sensor domain-containing diguanylate cyclase n=1 Tax=Gilvimarinus agarilyticus TaxID=679259 RepID=UPI0018DDB0A9|nr:diguanylate cyclase [Gilvimarinus agarilyticus]
MAVSLTELGDTTQPLGKHAHYWQESGESTQAELATVIEHWQAGKFIPSRHSVMSFGISAPSTWIVLPVSNQGNHIKERRLYIDTPWLNRIDVYLLHGNKLALKRQMGDAYHYGERSEQLTGFILPLEFAPGDNLLVLRLQTPDPMMVPLRLITPQALENFATNSLFSYGLSYGFLLALTFYNAMLFIGLRDRRYFLYTFYLLCFTASNFSYTGHAFAWIWPNSPLWQQWAQPVLMNLCGSSGLLFTLAFLDVRRRFVFGYRITLGLIALVAVAIAITYLLGQQGAALYVTFCFMVTFPLLMLALGIHQICHKNQSAYYFVAAVLAGLTGIFITAITTWGWIASSEWRFRAAEIGMLIEATALALALASQFRRTQIEQQRAEQDANTDALTGLSNRRALYRQLEQLSSDAQRHHRPLSVIIMDIDHFKKLNDTYGHAGGDVVLRRAGQVIAQSVRLEDIAARWGGEEFMIVMPQTAADAALDSAERLRTLLEAQHIPYLGHSLQLTASFGVAQFLPQQETIELLLMRADKALYHAKITGRNRSCLWQPELADTPEPTP